MHILVPVKRVVDHNVKVRVKSDGSGLDLAGVKMSINPFDEVALEQAVRLREQGLARRVTAVCCGDAAVQDVLRTALAMGADAALRIDCGAGPLEPLDPLGVAQALQALVQREDIGLVLCGKQAIDDDLGATGPMLAALLDWPQAVSVNRLGIEAGELQLGCDAERGLERLALPLPAVVCADLRLCEPRLITLPAMMRAKKAAIAVLPLAELIEAPAATTRLLSVAEPLQRLAGLRVGSTADLIARLQRLPALQPAGAACAAPV